MFKRKLLGMVLLVGMLFGQSVPSAQAAICDHIQFVSDLTAPDGATFAPGAAFTKTWRLKNIGTCTWTTAYTLVWTGGDALGTPSPVKLPVSVAPGQMLDISVKLTAPAASGNYKGLWKLSNATGTQFGIGASGQDPFWVSISVVQTSAVIYDFVANAPYAQWKSGAGALPFPITGGDDRGYAYQVNNPHLEDDSIDASAGLLTAPQNKYDGYIQATYPEIEIQKGDQLQTLVNCEFAATSCYVTFRVNYLLSNGVQGTLWSWKEAYDKKFYRKSINLDTLAGKKVRFVFMVFASGSASGDRAIWGAPRILRSGGQPPAPPATLTPLPPPAPTLTPFGPPPPTIAPAGCDKATFVSDVTVPDSTLFSPGTGFVKTWRLKNSGSCTWTSAYRLVFYNGEQMGAPTSINIPRNVAPGTTVDLTVNMVAPTNPGTYRGYWILSNAAGNLFGIGTDASKPIWVEVNVSGSSPVVSGYNFVLNACAAQWKSSAGILPCPGTEGDAKGFIIDRQFTQLEDGNMGPAPSLLVAPELKYNGYIQGIYPLFTVLPGDHFRGSTGCAYGSSCYVTFRLDYMTSTGSIKTFWTRREVSDQKNNTFDLDLAPLAGQNVRFILTLLATGSATNDKASWVAPMIVRLDTSGQIPPTVPPTNTPITMPGTIVPSPLIHKLYMLDAYSGWALGNSYVLRTNNGGATWYNVLPASGSGYFPNASRGWVLSGNILYRTTDGGRTWSQNEVPFSGGFIQFINDANGFVLSGELSGMNKHAVDLYQTTDGGTTWTLKYTNNPLAAGAGTSLPFSGHKNSMTFRDTLRGWVGGDYPSNGFVYFYKTN
ncbi:MAG TPA: NBR1-Ig-like domain-containing protein, partial [Anaerolineales bacterium]|nr:NBR1-Ig-like domain-containing protein [Anaerolineales bacterium]